MEDLRIREVLPVVENEALNSVCQHEYRASAGPGTIVEFASLVRGTQTIESDFDQGEAAVHVAALLGRRYSVVTVGDTVPLVYAAVANIGLHDRLASVRRVPCGVADFDESRIDDAVSEAAAAVLDDAADVIVMGCPGVIMEMARRVQKRFARKVGVAVLVIDPVAAAMLFADGQARRHLVHSRRAYPKH